MHAVTCPKRNEVYRTLCICCRNFVRSIAGYPSKERVMAAETTTCSGSLLVGFVVHWSVLTRVCVKRKINRQGEDQQSNTSPGQGLGVCVILRTEFRNSSPCIPVAKHPAPCAPARIVTLPVICKNMRVAGAPGLPHQFTMRSVPNSVRDFR